MTIYNIITDQGNSFLDAASQAYVRRGERYLRVEPKFLRAGDLLIYRKDHIKTDMTALDAILAARSEPYQQAKNTVLVPGTKVPRLRADILRGLLGDSAGLDEKILGVQSDLSVEEYRTITDLTHEVVKTNAERCSIPAPAWDTILGWIKGDVVAPADKRHYAALGTVNAVFSRIFEDFQSQTGFAAAYDHYMRVRRGIAAYVAQPHDDSLVEKASRWIGHARGTLVNERQLVLQELGSDIRSAFVDAQVVDIQRVTKKKEDDVRTRIKADPRLCKGIFCDVLPEKRDVVNIDDVLMRRAETPLVTVDALKEPERFVRLVKELCIEYGFPLSQVSDRLRSGKYYLPPREDIPLPTTEADVLASASPKEVATYTHMVSAVKQARLKGDLEYAEKFEQFRVKHIEIMKINAALQALKSGSEKDLSTLKLHNAKVESLIRELLE